VSETRCVHCGRGIGGHRAMMCLSNGQTGTKRFETMLLPDGKTCGDCRHVRRCIGMGFTESASETECDFFPIRSAPVDSGVGQV
jgi:hypothetical protein